MGSISARLRCGGVSRRWRECSCTYHLPVIAMPHTTDNAGYAARLITHGPFREMFWGGAIAMGGIVPLLLLLLAPASFALIGIAAVLALLGLLAFEWVFVMAGQSVPNS